MATRYVALLRGINVGGNNIIRMADLRACFESNGFDDVRTYIQSGNVLFDSSGVDPRDLTTRIEQMLSSEFDYGATVLLRSQSQFQAAVDGAPDRFGSEPEAYRYDVIFLIPPLTPTDALAEVETREDVDDVAAGPEVLYFRRLTERASQSRMSKLVSKPIYQRLTVRNWNTTTKLLALLTEPG
jgi:uncharacterized protein (DUF1697 family)